MFRFLESLAMSRSSTPGPASYTSKGKWPAMIGVEISAISLSVSTHGSLKCQFFLALQSTRLAPSQQLFERSEPSSKGRCREASIKLSYESSWRKFAQCVLLLLESNMAIKLYGRFTFSPHSIATIAIKVSKY